MARRLFDSPLIKTFSTNPRNSVINHVVCSKAHLLNLQFVMITHQMSDLGHNIETLGALKETCFSSNAYADFPLGIYKYKTMVTDAF